MGQGSTVRESLWFHYSPICINRLFAGGRNSPPRRVPWTRVCMGEMERAWATEAEWRIAAEGRAEGRVEGERSRQRRSRGGEEQSLGIGMAMWRMRWDVAEWSGLSKRKEQKLINIKSETPTHTHTNTHTPDTTKNDGKDMSMGPDQKEKMHHHKWNGGEWVIY
ncbi:hypothetical protein EX30DRAFT_266407 [Ascodesmis nigricans]|uniref:Uncharacterized protein n=1 Tax=Ascodesmis nigricans TaxID=341454 RepID=A0A4S2MP04_9PEZI|nr:hypothetical protein EX30DRAFT_266407 [Ascodesmis nigricans]